MEIKAMLIKHIYHLQKNIHVHICCQLLNLWYLF